jgi:predicted enzyme related to lactoylglutathione lyase
LGWSGHLSSPAVIHVTDVRAAVDEMKGRTENGIARMPGGGEAAWFKDSEGNLVGLVPAPAD